MDSWWRIKILARFWSATIDWKENYQINVLSILILWESDRSLLKRREREEQQSLDSSVSMIPIIRLLLWNSRIGKESPTEVPHQQERTVKWCCSWLGKALRRPLAIHKLILWLSYLLTTRHGEHPLSLHMSEWGSNGIWTRQSVFMVVTPYEKYREIS